MASSGFQESSELDSGGTELCDEDEFEPDEPDGTDPPG
jgi:hypothetical protein